MEDVPFGFLARLTYGLADQNSPGTPTRRHASRRGEGRRPGCGVGELRIGVSRVQSSSRGRSVADLHFSNLFTPEDRFRQFVNARYTARIHRSTDGASISAATGIRGVMYDSGVTGSKRLQFSLESVAFTPWRVKGVTFAFFTFADLDFIGSGPRNVLAQDLYSGLGLGVRLHKEAFGIGPLQLRFAWYPRIPVDQNEYAYTAFGEHRFRPIEFLGSSPEIVEY
jgi:hypothetical protein